MGPLTKPFSRREMLAASAVALAAAAAPGAAGFASADAHADSHTHPAPARTAGWSWKLPPNLITPASTHRNNVFYHGEPIAFTLGAAARSYAVRDYFGNLVEHGRARGAIALRRHPPGWYKLYIYGEGTTKQWGDIVGGTFFVVFRNDRHFPQLALTTPFGPQFSDPAMHGVIGMGPIRWAVQDAAKPEEAIRELEPGIQLEHRFYTSRDRYRRPASFIAFPNGTKGKSEGVKKIVEHFQHLVEYYEPRNEPNFGATPQEFVKDELIPFHDAVKGVDRRLKVLSPGTVSIDPGLWPWLDGFFAAGGGKHIDAFSFHAYNCCNGDLWLIRESMNSLHAMLKRHGLEHIEKWQTEQGYFAAVYGSYQPRLQGRWTMLQMMAYEQYGIPKEHNYYFYDESHGFWDVPTWWENGRGGSLNPAGALMRVWSEEIYGTRFKKAFDFGDANDIYVGNLFEGPGKRVATMMSAGDTEGRVRIKLARNNGNTSGRLRLVSAFGVESHVPVTNGVAEIPVPELPVYLPLTAGETLTVIPERWGKNLALQTGVTARASGNGAQTAAAASVDIAKIHNGQLENWYWSQLPGSAPWGESVKKFPVTVELTLPAPAHIGRVVLFCAPPWQWQGTLLNFDLQVRGKGGARWTTVGRVREDPKTFGVYTPLTRCTVDSFFSDRWIFQFALDHARLKSARFDSLRLLIHNCTWGGGATGLVAQAGGQCWKSPTFAIREIRVYG